MSDEKEAYPYIPERNWWTLRDLFKKQLPTAVTSSYLATSLKLANEKSGQNLIPSLRMVGLIDDEGHPTNRANEWRSDSSYKAICGQIVDEIYPRELLDLFPVLPIDRASLSDWFMKRLKKGQGYAGGLASMFTLLRTAEPKVMDDLQPKKISPAKQAKKETAATIEKDEEKPKTRVETSIIPNVHIDLQIHISPQATVEQIETIFASMAKYLGGR